MRKICVITSTRADYSLLRWLMEDIRKSTELKLQIVVTGMHLSPEFGFTANDVENDGFTFDSKVEMLLSSDTSVGVTKSMGLGLISFADVFANLEPDLVLVLGDRYEIFAAVSAAMIACIPVAHLHGGETTEGAFDEAIRHSITKMSHLHFVAADAYRQRVIQLGEDPHRVFHVGGLGVDNLAKVKLLERSELEASLDFKFGHRNLLITFHPSTLDKNAVADQMTELLSALETLKDTTLIFTIPNADTGGRTIIKMVKDFVLKHPRAKVFSSLGQLRYLSVLDQVDGIVGNSSSGLAEAPSFKKGTINIGDRQKGRLRANSIIDCDPVHESIVAALSYMYSDEFNVILKDSVNPYGTGGASERIVKVLKSYPLEGILKKIFYDLPIKCFKESI